MVFSRCVVRRLMCGIWCSILVLHVLHNVFVAFSMHVICGIWCDVL